MRRGIVGQGHHREDLDRLKEWATGTWNSGILECQALLLRREIPLQWVAASWARASSVLCQERRPRATRPVIQKHGQQVQESDNPVFSSCETTARVLHAVLGLSVEERYIMWNEFKRGLTGLSGPRCLTFERLRELFLFTLEKKWI